MHPLSAKAQLIACPASAEGASESARSIRETHSAGEPPTSTVSWPGHVGPLSKCSDAQPGKVGCTGRWAKRQEMERLRSEGGWRGGQDLWTGGEGSEVGGCHLKCECGGAHRQGPAAVKGVDGRLGLRVGLELDKGAAYSIQEQGGKGECSPSRAPNAPVAREPGGKEQKGQRARLGKRSHWVPLLVPSGPRSTVHSSMVPKGSNIFLTSSSVCCFPSIPTKSFRSSGG